MDQTVLLPIEGKGKYKLGNLSEEQINVLKEDPNNIFKALAIGGGTFLAYETFQHLVNIPKEDWENMLPDELEKFLSPFLHDNVDVEETIAENETELHTEDEISDFDEAENAAIIQDHSHEHYHNDITDLDDNDGNTDYDDHHNDTLIIDDEDDFDNNTDHHEMIEIDDISDIMEDEGIDHSVVEDFVSDTDFSIDSEMMDYIHSDDILIDLNDTSADEIIINDDYIADEDISIDDYSFDDGDLHSEHHTDDYNDDYINDDYDEDDNDNYMNHDNDSEHHDDYMDDDDDDDDDYETEDDDHHLNDDDSDLDDADDTL